MQSFIGLWSMESAKRKCWKFKLCITESKKSLNITQKSVPTTVTTNERTIISETKYFLIAIKILNNEHKFNQDFLANNYSNENPSFYLLTKCCWTRGLTVTGSIKILDKRSKGVGIISCLTHSVFS